MVYLCALPSNGYAHTHTQYTCLHLKGCYGVNSACMAESFRAELDMLYIYIYGTRVYWSVREGNVHFLRKMRGNDKKYLDSKVKYEGMGDVCL
jgi:hypothetical protein